MVCIEQFKIDLSAVGVDLIHLDADHQMWWYLNENLKEHAWSGDPGNLFFFITNSHFVSFGMGLRRQLDSDKRTVCLAKLIGHVAARRIIFRRDEFVAKFRDANDKAHADTWTRIGEEQFSKLAGDNVIREYPAGKAVRHLEWLKEYAKPIHRFVDKSVAHKERQEPASQTIKKYQNLLRIMIRMQEHYSFLAKGTYPKLDGSILLDSEWTTPLLFPWRIDPDRHRGLCTMLDDGERPY